MPVFLACFPGLFFWVIGAIGRKKSKMDNEGKGIRDKMKSQPSHHRKPQKFGPGNGERDMNAFDDPIAGDPIDNDHGAESRDADDLVTLARRYYAANFPNPERLGCPPSGEIAQVVG